MVTGPAQRSSVSTSGRGSAIGDTPGSRTTASPARRPDWIRITSPTDSASNDCDDRGPAFGIALAWHRVFSRSEIWLRSCWYSAKSPRWQCISARQSAIALSLRVIWRVMPTTERSAWNWAKDDSSSSRAVARPTWETRLIAML